MKSIRNLIKDVEDIKLSMEKLELMEEVILDLMKDKSNNRSDVEKHLSKIIDRQQADMKVLYGANEELLKKVAELEGELEKYRYTE